MTVSVTYEITQAPFRLGDDDGMRCTECRKTACTAAQLSCYVALSRGEIAAALECACEWAGDVPVRTLTVANLVRSTVG